MKTMTVLVMPNMAIGYVLIVTAPTKEHDIYSTLSDLDEIVEVHPLFGQYDLIAKIEAKNLNVLGDIVVNKIRNLPGVVETKTLPGCKV
jgi:DNA-binding Lrp family transcriptional regulator